MYLEGTHLLTSNQKAFKTCNVNILNCSRANLCVSLFDAKINRFCDLLGNIWKLMKENFPYLVKSTRNIWFNARNNTHGVHILIINLSKSIFMHMRIYINIEGVKERFKEKIRLLVWMCAFASKWKFG